MHRIYRLLIAQAQLHLIYSEMPAAKNKIRYRAIEKRG